MRYSRGFTLIELLVVISVIALLSSVMITTFATGRGKARDSNIKQQVTQMRTLMAREFSDNGNYDNLKANGTGKAPGVLCTVGTGTTHLKGTYADDFKAQCDALMQLYGNSCRFDGTGGVSPVNCLKFDLPTGQAQKFSITAYLPEESRRLEENTYLCMGSNGRLSTSNMIGVQTQNPGCYADPGL
ncbi:MAG: type II secretion system protein [Patescibacteria group bacterium]